MGTQDEQLGLGKEINSGLDSWSFRVSVWEVPGLMPGAEVVVSDPGWSAERDLSAPEFCTAS